jgi:hypothetical protein
MTNFMSIGLWPSDPLEQQLVMQQLKLALRSKTDSLFETAAYRVELKQTTVPTQGQWESAWTAQTGLPTPILPSATLIWTDTNYTPNVIGGIYGTTPLSTTVVRRESRYPVGGTSYFGSASLSAAVSNNAAINTNNSSHPSLTAVLPVVSDLLLTYSLYVNLVSGTGNWGADFLVNGVKAGTQYQGISTVSGLVVSNTSGLVQATIHIPNLPAGSYKIQALFGVTGAPTTPPVIAYGGIGAGANQYGYRVLTVRGIAV